MYDAFISYSTKDRPAADAVCAALEARGLRCWIAPRDVVPGTGEGEAVVGAIPACRAVVLTYSSHAGASARVRREVERAAHHDRPIVPVKIEDVPVSKALDYFIHRPRWVNAVGVDPAEVAGELAAVLHELTVAEKEEAAPAPKAARRRMGLWVVAGVAPLAVALVAGLALVPGLRKGSPSRTQAPPSTRLATAPSNDPKTLAALPPASKPSAGQQGPGRWVKSPNNPILGSDQDPCDNPCVIHDGPTYRMYFRWPGKKAIGLTESTDAVHWGLPVVVLELEPSDFSNHLLAGVAVVKRDVYHLWYGAKVEGGLGVKYVTSFDGKTWTRLAGKFGPVLSPEQNWERREVRCQSVLWDEARKLYRMWYRGGGTSDSAIGYATSPDGVTWIKDARNPIFQAGSSDEWDSSRIAGCAVVQAGDWYFMFYSGSNGQRHELGLARSRDGIVSWERYPANPLLSPSIGEWDGTSLWAPSVIKDRTGWRLWYAGKSANNEWFKIGAATLEGTNLGF